MQSQHLVIINQVVGNQIKRWKPPESVYAGICGDTTNLNGNWSNNIMLNLFACRNANIN
jgi:hypothetical protein